MNIASMGYGSPSLIITQGYGLSGEPPIVIGEKSMLDLLNATSELLSQTNGKIEEETIEIIIQENK